VGFKEPEKAIPRTDEDRERKRDNVILLLINEALKLLLLKTTNGTILWHTGLWLGGDRDIGD
jgi:hypothetical protein